MIFTARQVQEKCREQHQDLYMIFIDLAKAFDSVREGLWLVLRKIEFECPVFAILLFVNDSRCVSNHQPYNFDLTA